MLEAYDAYLAVAKTLEPGMAIFFAPQGFTAGTVRAGKKRNDGNLLGLYEGSQMCNYETMTSIHTDTDSRAGHDVYMTFPNVDQYPAAQKAISFWSSTVTKIAKDGGAFLLFIYSNNGNADSKILSGYGEDNFNFIRKTARKYDPHGVMQTLQNDGFLIRKEE
jgi:hypothetical protein